MRLSWLRDVIVFAAGVMACQPGDDEEGRMPQGNPTDTAVAAEALTFGGIELPPSATVVGVEEDTGIDRMYRLVVEAPPADVERMLSDAVPSPEDAARSEDELMAAAVAEVGAVRAARRSAKP